MTPVTQVTQQEIQRRYWSQWLSKTTLWHFPKDRSWEWEETNGGSRGKEETRGRLELLSLSMIIMISALSYCSNIGWNMQVNLSPILASLHWLPIHLRISKLLYLLLNPSTAWPCPTSLSCYTLQAHSRSQVSWSPAPECAENTAKAQRGPCGLHIRKTLSVLKSRLKTHLFSLCFYCFLMVYSFYYMAVIFIILFCVLTFYLFLFCKHWGRFYFSVHHFGLKVFKCFINEVGLDWILIKSCSTVYSKSILLHLTSCFSSSALITIKSAYHAEPRETQNLWRQSG